MSRVREKPSPKSAAVQLRRRVVIVGGMVDAEVSRVCWSLNKSNKFEELCKIPFPLEIGHSVCKTKTGFAITGGKGSDLCIMFNASTKTWTKMKNMLKPRFCHGSVAIKDVIYVIGGETSASMSSMSVDCLPIDGGSWQIGPDMPLAMSWPAVADLNGGMYVLEMCENNQLLHLDVAKKVWHKRAPPPAEFAGASMTSVNGQLIVAGGVTYICAVYNPATDAWSMGQQPNGEHEFGALVHHDKTVLLLGGSLQGSGFGDVEELSIQSGCWSASCIKMPASLGDHHSLVLDIPGQ